MRGEKSPGNFLLLALVVAFIIFSSSGSIDLTVATNTDTRSDDETISITTNLTHNKEEKQTRPFNGNLTIEGDGFVTAVDMILRFIQEVDFQYKVIIRDYGRLVLDDSILNSNRSMALFLYDDASLEITRSSQIDLDGIEAHDNSSIIWRSSTIPHHNLTLDCHSLTIEDVDIENLSIGNVDNLTLVNSKVHNLSIHRAKSIQLLDGSTISDLSIDSSTSLRLNSSTVKDCIINEISGIRCEDSLLEDVNIVECSDIQIVDGGVLKGSQIEMVSQTLYVDASSIFNLSLETCSHILIERSQVMGTQEETLSICRADVFEASGTTFQNPLTFNDNSQVILTNCTIPSVTLAGEADLELNGWDPTEIDDYGVPHTPKIEVTGTGNVHIYHWLNVHIIDNSSNPLEDVEVKVVKDLSNDLVMGPYLTDESGELMIRILATRISSTKEVFQGNYKVMATKDDYMAESLAYMNEDLDITLRLEVEQEKDDDTPWLMYIIIIVVVIFLMVLLMSLSKGSKGSKGSSRKGSSGRNRRR